MGAPGAFANLDRQRARFLAQIPRHAQKSDFAVVDLTGASTSQVGEVMGYYKTLDRSIQVRVMVINCAEIVN